LEVHRVRVEVVGAAGDALILVDAESDFERAHDLARDVLLDREDVLELAVVGFRPAIESARGVDQLCRDHQLVAGLSPLPSST
jgi:hypothetical protein